MPKVANALTWDNHVLPFTLICSVFVLCCAHLTTSIRMAPTTPSAAFYSGDLPYARPTLIRPPSPAGSINTEYGPDETDTEELAMSDEAFERKILAELKIDQPTESETQADVPPLRFPYCEPGSHDERGVWHRRYLDMQG